MGNPRGQSCSLALGYVSTGNGSFVLSLRNYCGERQRIGDSGMRVLGFGPLRRT